MGTPVAWVGGALLGILSVFAAVVLAAQPAAAATERPPYAWPLKPCDQQHPVRAHLGAPRTIFEKPLGESGLDGSGRVSFHNGVDIVAPAGEAVYPVVSGTVRRISGGLAVITEDGREFRYQHISRVARAGERVFACRSVLGHVLERKDHVHFVEVDRGDVVNPLSRGRLSPYRDRTRPRVASVSLLSGPASGGRTIEIDRGSAARAFRSTDSVTTLSGRVRVGAEAYDVPAVAVDWPREWASMRLLPLVPAALELTLRRVGKRRVASTLVGVFDFRRAVPSNEEFWRVYRRGTHQNWPVIGGYWHKGMPGTYRFRLPRLDTRSLANGRYILRLTALDTRGNRGSLRLRVRIRN